MLPESLAKNLHNNSVNIKTGDDDELGFVDLETGEKVGSLGGVPKGQDGHFLRVSRNDFRNYLLDGADFPVSMGKNCTHYTEDEQSVTAHFADGTSATGSLLVGADGVHSHILNQLIGEAHHRPSLSVYIPIFGEVTFPKRFYGPVRKLGNAVVLAGASGVRLQIGMLHMSEDLETASFFWALMPKRENPEELSEWVHTASKQEVYDFVVKATKGWHPTLRDAVLYGGPESIVHPPPKFLEYVTPDSLPGGRVTVLGDAAHAMIPFRGAGVNTAILDACDMGTLLLQAHKEGHDFSSVVDTYLQRMIPRGRENVLSSRAAGEDMGHPAQEWAVKFRRP